MKTVIRIVSLLFAALLLFASCAQSNVTAPAETKTSATPDKTTQASTAAPTKENLMPGETDVVKLTALFREYVEGTVLKLCADDTVTAFLDGLGETYETVYGCGDSFQNMDCTGQYAHIRKYWSSVEMNSGEKITSGLSAGFERGSAVLTPLGMDFGYCLDVVVDLSVLPLEKDDGLARTKLYKEGDKLVYEYQTDRTARLTFTLADGAIASFGFEWEKITFEECLEPAVPESADLMARIVAERRQGKEADDEFISAAAKFDVELFRTAVSYSDGGNVIMSPLSVMLALAMTANGAAGQTLAEFENYLGGGMSMEKLNEYLCRYMNDLPSSEDCKFSYADGIFVNSNGGFDAKADFLQTNADYYSAGVYRMPFNDEALDAINDFVKEHTDGMIEKILEMLHPNARMVLVNALCFDAKWQEPYTTEQVGKETFNALDGSKQTVDMMHSEEEYLLNDENAVGFVKLYADTRYGFAALLPEEGVSIYDYIASLTGQRLTTVLSSRKNSDVIVTLPKFSAEFSTEMGEYLPSLGIPSAFNPLSADFSRMADNHELHIGRVVHKGFIEVSEGGTKAAAATAVEMRDNAMPFEVTRIVLDRPFVYTIFDTETDLPIFIGVLTSVDA